MKRLFILCLHIYATDIQYKVTHGYNSLCICIFIHIYKNHAHIILLSSFVLYLW